MVRELAGPFESESGQVGGQLPVLKSLDIVGFLGQIFA